MYVAFTKDNPHADGRNGPRTALIHGSAGDVVSEHHFPTGKRCLRLTKAGHIPGLDAEVKAIFACFRTEFASDAGIKASAEKLAADTGWSLEVRDGEASV